MALQDPITPSSQQALAALTSLKNSREQRAIQAQMQREGIAAGQASDQFSAAVQMQLERSRQESFNANRIHEAEMQQRNAEHTATLQKDQQEFLRSENEKDRELREKQLRMEDDFRRTGAIRNIQQRRLEAQADAQVQRNNLDENREAALNEMMLKTLAQGASSLLSSNKENTVATLAQAGTDMVAALAANELEANTVAANVAEALTGRYLSTSEGLLSRTETGAFDLTFPKDDLKEIQKNFNDKELLHRAIGHSLPSSMQNRTDDFIELIGALGNIAGMVQSGREIEGSRKDLYDRYVGQAKELVDRIKERGATTNEIVGALYGTTRSMEHLSKIVETAWDLGPIPTINNSLIGYSNNELAVAGIDALRLNLAAADTTAVDGLFLSGILEGHVVPGIGGSPTVNEYRNSIRRAQSTIFERLAQIDPGAFDSLKPNEGDSISDDLEEVIINHPIVQDFMADTDRRWSDSVSKFLDQNPSALTPLQEMFPDQDSYSPSDLVAAIDQAGLELTESSVEAIQRGLAQEVESLEILEDLMVEAYEQEMTAKEGSSNGTR